MQRVLVLYQPLGKVGDVVCVLVPGFLLTLCKVGDMCFLLTLCKICGAVCLGYLAKSGCLHHYRVELTLCQVDWSYDTLHGKHKAWFDDDDFNIFFAEIQDVLCPDFYAEVIRQCLSLAGSNLFMWGDLDGFCNNV